MEGAWLGGRVSGCSQALGCQWQASHCDACQALVHQGWAAVEDKQVLQQGRSCPSAPARGGQIQRNKTQDVQGHLGFR